MLDNFKSFLINEDLMDFEDPEVIYLKNLIEDTLIDTNCSISYDIYIQMRGNITRNLVAILIF